MAGQHPLVPSLGACGVDGASLVARLVKSPLHCRRARFHPWVGKVPWRRERLPTPVFLGFPGGSAGVDDVGGNPRIPLTTTGRARLLSLLPSAALLRVTHWDVGNTFTVQAASGPKGWGISFPRL